MLNATKIPRSMHLASIKMHNNAGRENRYNDINAAMTTTAMNIL